MAKTNKTMNLAFALMVGSAGAAYAGIPAVNSVQNVQQDETCTGIVKDATGETVIGASILIKGTSNGTVTDIDGNFSLKGVKKGSILRISYVGFEPQEVTYNGKPLEIILKDDSKALEEVVVTALGIKKDAKKLGYAVSSINAEDLNRTGGANLAAGLYGKASGVRIQSAPGGGTSAVSISVRGLSSINGNTQPLLILDGVPIHNGNTNNNDYWGNQDRKSVV